MSEASVDSSWVLSGLILPTSSMIVRVISLFCLGMGFILSGPFVFLIILDIFIWIWRMCRNKTPPPTTNHSMAHSTSIPPSEAIEQSGDEKNIHGGPNEKI